MNMSLREYQARFAAHVRDPAGAPRPAGVPARRMRVYNRLLYNNIEGFLLACFPVCRKVLGQRRWTRLVRAFFRDHVCESPYFRRIPEEFLAYLVSRKDAGDPVFLPELAHYEWVELDLDTAADDASASPCDPRGDPWHGQPLLNPVMRVLAYRWPVHRIGPRHKPTEMPDEPTCLLVYRDAGLRVRFMTINPATFELLSVLRREPGLTGQAAAERCAATRQHAPTALRDHATALFADLRRRGVLLGTLP